MGILILHARQMQRSLSRIPEVERIVQPSARDPSEIASSHECEEELDRAFRSLPDRYREVLVPRFRLGLRGEEIARNTGRSPGVVRMQIHRGLELLKRALPQSFLTVLLGFLWSRRALTAVRTRVLAVERLCYFRVELSDPSLAHALNILDEEGNHFEIAEQGAMQIFKKTPYPLRNGKTEVISTSDRACTIRLIGETQRLLPVRLMPGEVTVLRF